MASVNKWIGVGNLGKDPMTRYLPSGDAVCSFSIACSESWKDKNSGEKKEHTEWVNISTFGKLAEICAEYLKKGSQVYIEGKIQTRKWQDKEGVDRYSTEIKADQMKMLGGKPAHQQDSDERPAPEKRKGGSFADMDSDIPFAPIGRGIGGHAI